MTRILENLRNYLSRKQQSLTEAVAESIVKKAIAENPTAAALAASGSAHGLAALMTQVETPESGGGGGSFLSSNTARVDSSGDDSTGAIGDLGKPFLTVQAAIAAFEANPVARPLIDTGINDFSENLTTSLTHLQFTGVDGFTSFPFNSLTFTSPDQVIYCNFFRCYAATITAASTGLLYITITDAGLGGVTNSAGPVTVADDIGISYISSITAAGDILCYGMSYVGALSAPGFNIQLTDCMPRYANADGTYTGQVPTITSAGSAVSATRAMIGDVVAASSLLLVDSRVVGTNNATSTVYADVLLASIKLATPATTGTMTVNMGNADAQTVTPTGACTFNASGGQAGNKSSFVVTTSGTSSFTLTFGTNFKTTGTLATGTVSGKTFTISFAYDGTNWCETSRTTAM